MKTLIPRLLATLCLVSGLGLCAWNQTDPADATAMLNKVFDEFDQWERYEFPDSAMQRGDYRYADRITDNSLAAIERRHEHRQTFRRRLAEIDRKQLSEADLVSLELFELRLEGAIEGHQYRSFLAPVGSRFGPQQSIPQMGEHVRFESVEDYANYVSRLEQVPGSIDSTIALLRLGLEEGRVPPQVVLESVPGQFAALVDGGVLADRLVIPFQNVPPQVDRATVQAIQQRLESVVVPSVSGAMAALGDFMVEEYIPRCRETIAAADWPDGEAYYAHQLWKMTTTRMTPEEIHQLGLREVARIRGEMMDVIRSSDFMELHPDASALGDEALFAAFIEYLRTDPRFYYEEEEELLDGYRAICKEIDGHMPHFFAVLPRLPYGVRPIPRFMAAGQTTAYYRSGDIRNAEAGYFYANTYALDQRPKYEMISLALHEAVPGHHHQIGIAKELEDVPEFRRNTWFTAFGEGWALYAERLGIEMGLFDDPYNDFGRLLYEMWRACRLVVDPGMHAMGWSRDRAVEYMLANTALSELNINNEIDRYIAWPGQATAYKIGELKIRELREGAESLLGESFDIREFHDLVLGAGSVPLSVLERRVTDWVKHKRLDGISYD